MKITMKRLTIISGLALLLAGCGRKAQSPPPLQPEAHASAPEAAPVAINETPREPPPLPAAADLDAELAQMTRELRKWIVRNQRPPKSFEEFAASASFQVPAAPAGKKFALSKQMRVVVVNR
jgi:predicted small lipoprotein YifL